MSRLPTAVGIFVDGLLMLLCMLFAVALVGVLVVETTIRGWRNTARWIKVATVCAAGALLVLMVVNSGAMARDDGRYAQSPHKQWFDQLKNKKGYPCCSDADGFAVSDPDWESRDGRYRVKLEDGIWYDVPDEAVITEPNRVGRTMVWPVPGVGGKVIRCFMPGAMT